MKNFKEFLNEVEKDNQLAKSVKRDLRPKTTSSKQIGFIHFNHGVDYDVIQADSHDLAYFGKGVVRLKGRTTGKETVAYVDWKHGTIRFNSGTDNDKEFDKPAKFKAAGLYESLEDLELLENAAMNLIECDDLTESVKDIREKVIAVLVKRGFNEKDAEKMVDKNLKDAMKIRPSATPGKLAEIVSTL